jgi:signal transduction histidine kinase/CheY-like chemotaxis protein
MFPSNFSLQELIQPVPTSLDTATLLDSLKLLSQQSSDRLVVVDDSGHPIGLVQLQNVLPLVMAIDHPTDDTPSSWVAQNTLQSQLRGFSAPLVQKLVVLPVDWSISQVADYFCAHASHHAAIVNHQGCFLGLLDSDRLWKAIALHSNSESAQNSGHQPDAQSIPQSPLSSGPVHPLSAGAHYQQHIVQLTQQLLAQRAELEQRITTQQDEIKQLRSRQNSVSLSLSSPRAQANSFLSDLSLLNSVLELLERLPLPLMLQTSNGRVLAQNPVWRQQISELLNPNEIHRDAAQWLEHSGSSDTASTNAALNPTELDPSSSDAANLCHLGSTPNTCICVCSLKDGGEQTLQLIKIPFGTLLPGWHLDWSRIDPQTDGANSDWANSEVELSEQFRLASLTWLPDSDRPRYGSPTQKNSSSNALQELSQSHTSVAQSSPPLAASSANASPLSPSSTHPPEALWIVLAQDITEQQQLARELTAKNADLMQLNRLKDEFLACISHELKTPLTAVLGLSSLLKDQTLGEMSQRQVHYAQLIYQSSRHLMSVVNDIFDLTRIETGQLELLYEPVQVEAICTRAFEQASQGRSPEATSPDVSADQLATQFSLEVEPGLETLIVDELRLRQMLVNLLSNALKFTEINSPIGLRVSRWGGWIAFTVWDTGIGIPAEKQHLIFQKFQQLENPLTRRFDGAGLGLVLTHRLARLHGGDVTFISKENEGSQFTILLPPTPPGKTYLARSGEDDSPVMMQTEQLGERVPLLGSQGHSKMGETIAQETNRSRLMLIVEADPQLIETLSNKLTALGYRVVIARSGTEALEKARRLQPCILFLSPLLPLLSGWDVLTLLKSSAETRHIPVVITATAGDEEQSHRSHANSFLSLPIRTKTLQQTIQQLLLSPTEPPPPHTRPTHGFTLLRLRQGEQSPLTDLTLLLQLYRYRILESDDLEQAELLARVWKPNVVLIESAISDPHSYLQQLSYHSFLSSLPIVTLDPQTTQAANQIPGLLVFPCLSAIDSPIAPSTPDVATLLQVIQVAAGFVWRPTVLAIDSSILASSIEGHSEALSLEQPDVLGDFPKEGEWLQALMQYLQTAGFRGSIEQSWPDVVQQMQTQSCDVLLLCWTNQSPSVEELNQFALLAQLESKPPIIVLDHRSSDQVNLTDPSAGSGLSPVAPLPDVVHQVATIVIVPPISITDLLDRIHQVMHTHTVKGGQERQPDSTN